MTQKGPTSALESETFGEDTSFRVQQPVGSMSISPCGRDVVLASTEGLHIIDLDSPYSPPRYLPHHTSWEVADVQWSPFAARDFWVASTSNQKAIVWNLGMRSWQDSIEHVLHGHTRAITDINFSAHHPDVLATCAVDSFVHCWDLRIPARPVESFSDWFAGATQVKWSRQDSHVVASSHDKYLRIWDDRMGAYPVRSIEAHNTKIYGVDWNRFHPNKIVTCSLDKTIKFWDCDNLEDVPERIIQTPFPVWRARHTPFGWGLLAMPQRGNSDLHLYDRRPVDGEPLSGAVSPVVDFPGHKGQVKEFLWRARGTPIDGIDYREFQLVSWGTDRELRLHRIAPETMLAVGYERGKSRTQKLNFTRKGAKYKSFRDEPQEQEFSDVFDSQSGSLPASGPSFQFRPRGSTSVGMNKVSIPHARGWVHGGPTSRIGMHGKANVRQDMDPIAWMKNVKTASWEDTLAEEITQVGEMFAKVNFEKVDIQQRKATISMQGPWGHDYSPMFMKIDISFPKTYPREANALFKVQKTSSMTDVLASTLSTELRTIAETYLSRKRGCLEAALRYLLREQNMEQIVTWVLDESMDDSKLLEALDVPADISSDEDDERLEPFQGATSLLSASEVLNANVMVPVAKACGAMWSECGKLICFFPPKPKEPPSFLNSLAVKDIDRSRPEKVFGGFGRLQASSPITRTATGTVNTADETNSEFSNDSLSSSPSSSSTSDMIASLPTGFQPANAWRRGIAGLQRSRSADYSNRSTNGLGITKSTSGSPSNVVSIHDFTDLIPSKSGLAVRYKVYGSGPEVCDHNAQVAANMDHETIAHVWTLVGLLLKNEVPLECTSSLATGQDIITVAQSAKLSLRRKDSGVGLNHLDKHQTRKIVTNGRVRWGESSFGSRYLITALFDYFEQLADVQMLAMLSCVLAEPKAADPREAFSRQHLHDQSMPLKSPAFSIDYYPSLEVARSIINQASVSAIAIPAKSPSISAAFNADNSYPSGSAVITAGSGSDPSISTGTTPPFHSVYSTHDRRRSSRPADFNIRDIRDKDSASVVSSNVSVSTSPEDTRMSGRSNSHLAFSFSRAGISALAQSYSNSPPGNNAGASGNGPIGAKKSSPSGSVGGGGWNTAGLFGGSVGSRGGRSAPPVSAASSDEYRTTHLLPSTSFTHSQSLSSDGGEVLENGRRSAQSASKPNSPQKSSTRSSTVTTKRKIRIKVSLQNQNKFDNDGYASAPLLDPRLDWKFKAYRASYAHLLGVWEMHPQMAEILKFDGLIGYFAQATPGNDTRNASLDKKLSIGNLRRRKTAGNFSKTGLLESRHLELRRRCLRCGQALTAVEKNGRPIGWHCASTPCSTANVRISTRSLCTICRKTHTGLMFPCLECGHTTCFDCAEGWFSNPSQEGDDEDPIVIVGNNTCPSGCGCLCPTYQIVSVPFPPEANPVNEYIHEDVHPQKGSRSTSIRSHRLMSEHGPDKAIEAFLSLSRTRSVSGAAVNSSRAGAASVARAKFAHGTYVEPEAIEDEEQQQPNKSEQDEMQDPWAGSKYATLGRGVGGGLSRGLSSKASNNTIRKDAAGTAREKRADSVYERV